MRRRNSIYINYFHINFLLSGSRVEQATTSYFATEGCRTSHCSSISEVSICQAELNGDQTKDSHNTGQGRNNTEHSVPNCRQFYCSTTPDVIICLPPRYSSENDGGTSKESSFGISDYQPTAAPFRTVPAMANCSSCGTQVLTCTEYRVSGANWALAGLLCAFGCHLGCCLLPFFLNSYKDVIHVCPLCGIQLGKYGQG